MDTGFKTTLISTVRVGISALVGVVVTWLVTNNLIDEEAKKQIAFIVDSASIVVGTMVYYALSRMIQGIAPRMLLLKNPNPPVSTMKPLLLFAVLLSVACVPAFSEAQLVRRTWVVQQQQFVPQNTVCSQGVCYPVVQQQVFRPALIQAPTLSRTQPIYQAPIVISQPSSVVVDAPNETVLATALIGDRPFVQTVRKACQAAREAGEITAFEQARIMTAVRLRRLGPEVEQLTAAELQVETGATGLIDWDNFDVEKFVLLVKTILEILAGLGILGLAG